MPAPGPPPTDDAEAAPQSKATAKASPQAQHEANPFAVPVRGREAVRTAEHSPVCSQNHAGTMMPPWGDLAARQSRKQLGQQRI